MMNYGYPDLKNILDNNFKKFAAKTAVSYFDENDLRHSCTYGELSEAIRGNIAMLENSGLGRSDRIALISKHSVFVSLACLMLAYAGCTAVLIDASLPAAEINRLLKYSDVRALFVTRDLHGSIDAGLMTGIPVFEICAEPNVYTLYEDSDVLPARQRLVPVNEKVISIIYSSGTTGEMKGVEVTYQAMVCSSQCAAVFAGFSKDIEFLHLLPANHIAGYSMLFICFLLGSGLGFVHTVDAYHLSEGFHLYNPSSFIIIPKIFELMKNRIEQEVAKKSFPVRFYFNFMIKISGFMRKKFGIRLRFLSRPFTGAVFGKNMYLCGSGTAPCPAEVAAFYLNLGIDFLNVYGATETGFPITATTCIGEKYPQEGAGKVDQFSFINVIVADPDETGLGEVRVKTPLIMNGYFRDEALTKEAFDENGYFKTGDCGYIDSSGNLFVTGRTKETIMLASGKKVSPPDVDNYYQKACLDFSIASCGIPDAGGLYDKIFIFIETAGKSPEEAAAAREAVLKLSRASDNNYKAAEIRLVERIPTTSIGKVKRVLLRSMYMEEVWKAEDAAGPGGKIRKSDSDQPDLYEIIGRIAGENGSVSDDTRLAEDLGYDSLMIFELCTEIESRYGISISQALGDVKTAGNLANIVKNVSNSRNKSEKSNRNKYPAEKNQGDIRLLKKLMKLSRTFYSFSVSGRENVAEGQRYIFCPNHESHLDSLWVWTALGDKADPEKICGLAKQEHLERAVTRRGLKILGGIPVDRSGNTAPAMADALRALQNEHYSMLIHPEGTRTRSGAMGAFRNGAAALSAETGVQIVPVFIGGAFEIYPPDRKLPKLFDFKNMRKYHITIKFGTPVAPAGKTPEQITEEVRLQIVRMKKAETE